MFNSKNRPRRNSVIKLFIGGKKMKKYVLVLETENVIAKFPYTDKEFAKKRFEENIKSKKFIKVELIVEGEEEDFLNEESELPF